MWYTFFVEKIDFPAVLVGEWLIGEPTPIARELDSLSV